MTKDKAKQLIKDGWKIKVIVRPNNKYDKAELVTMFFNENTNIVHPVYYNHIKEWLNDEQLKFIELYNRAKNFVFRDDVEINMKYKQLTETRKDIEVRVMRSAIKKLEYLEQL